MAIKFLNRPEHRSLREVTQTAQTNLRTFYRQRHAKGSPVKAVGSFIASVLCGAGRGDEALAAYRALFGKAFDVLDADAIRLQPRPLFQRPAL